jgi:N-acetylglucosaminyldiphosphoundecaprenol N-acetyl-beta-D-mannosaminyltransferase
MYLRYGEIAWDAGDGASAAQAVLDPARLAPPAPRGSHELRPPLPVIRLRRVELHEIDEATAIKHILDELDAGFGGFVVTPNLDHLRRCGDDLSFGALVAEADLVLADGMPLVWAARLQGTPLPGRVAGSDMIWSLSQAAADAGRSIFMLGGSPGTADSAARALVAKYPAIKVAGTHCPPLGFENDETQIARLINKLQAVNPDIVYVALGSPKQEFLIERIRRSLPKTWWLGVGISFSFVCGDVRRAPRWMQKTGLEWVHRLWQEPRRLFKRYILLGLPFAASLMCGAAITGITRKFRRITPGGAQRRAARYSLAGSDGHGSSSQLLPRETPMTPSSPGSAVVVETTPAGVAKSDNGQAAKALSRLRSVVLLGGSLRQTEMGISIGRAILDLPVDESGSILNHWLSHAAELAQYAGLSALPVQVLVSRNTPEPASASQRYSGSYRVLRDQSDYRGTGGVLRDLAHDYDDNDLVLVANAAQLLLDPLSVIAAALDHKCGDVSLISHQDGTPSGVMLVRCKTLRLIPPAGFVDMKEQALPLIAQQFDVKVMQCRRPSGLPIRSLGDYIAALRHFHRRRIGKPATGDALAEDWQPTFAIVEDGAIVAPGAHVHDAVVLKGGVVEAGASVVRCLVCPGGVVKQKSTVVDAFVRAAR